MFTCLAKKCLWQPIEGAHKLGLIQRLFVRSKSKNVNKEFYNKEMQAKILRWGRVCIKAPRRSELKCIPPSPTVGDWMFHPECRKDPCPPNYPRFDKMYYKVSDKAKRKYQQTWFERDGTCKKRPPIDFSKLEPIPHKKRTIEEIHKLTHFKPQSSMKCNEDNPCFKLKSPGCCVQARDNPSCFKTLKPSGCKKRLCPYPSFSECVRPHMRKPIYRECACWKFDGMCEVWAQLRRKEIYNLK